MIPDRSKQHGFLYVEVLLGFFLLSIVLLAVIPVFLTSAKMNAASAELDLEANLALSKVEQLMEANYAALGSGQDEAWIGPRLFRRTWVVTGDSPHAGMKAVTVTVQPEQQSDWGNPRVTNLSFFRGE